MQNGMSALPPKADIRGDLHEKKDCLAAVPLTIAFKWFRAD